MNSLMTDINPNKKTMQNKTLTVKCTCNDQTNPMGIDDLSPRFAWQMSSEEQGQRQTAYRIVVTDNAADLDNETNPFWDTGKVDSSESLNIEYDGVLLKPRKKYFWKIRQWDKDGKPCLWSEIATFEMGLMGVYLGKWIGAPTALSNYAVEPSPAPMLRTKFFLSDDVAQGRVYICGLGYHELYVNGNKAIDSLLAPGVSQYDKHVLYETIDVTNMLHKGENVIGVILGNGFYNCYTLDSWSFRYATWRGFPRLWMEGHFLLNNGEETTEASDAHWKVASGPILTDGLRNGEKYDSRLNRPGWALPEYDDKDFKPVSILRPPGGLRISQQHPPIREIQVLTAKSVYETEADVWIYDFGQNLSGFISIEAPGFRDAHIKFRYSERIDEKGNIDTRKISEHIKSGEFQTDHYIMCGDDLETWEPRFTYHGFRYVEITGYPGKHNVSNFKAKVVHTDIKTRGEFVCSNDTINKIQDAVLRSTLTNYHGIPTDCPHREKNGWTGDAHLSAEQVLLNFDPKTAYRKWMGDFSDAQHPDGQLPGIVPTGGAGYRWGNGPAWDSAIALIPWYQYQYTGDKKILTDNFANIKRYVDFLKNMEDDGIVEYGLGDWCHPDGKQNARCPVVVTDTAFYHTCASIASKIATTLKEEKDANHYSELASRIRSSFRREFVSLKNRTVYSGCQTTLACALYNDMINPD